MSCPEVVVALKVLVEVWTNDLASKCWVLKPLLLETGFRNLCAFISLETPLWGVSPLNCAVCLWHSECRQLLAQENVERRCLIWTLLITVFQVEISIVSEERCQQACFNSFV